MPPCHAWWVWGVLLPLQVSVGVRRGGPLFREAGKEGIRLRPCGSEAPVLGLGGGGGTTRRYTVPGREER